MIMVGAGIKTRLITRLAALLRALAAEQT